MASYVGTVNDFFLYVGPHITNRIPPMTRAAKEAQGNICEMCGKKAVLDSAHKHGRERKVIINEILKEYVNEAGIVTCPIDEVVTKVMDAHNPISEVFLFLCRDCHRDYDSQVNEEAPQVVENVVHEGFRGETVDIRGENIPVERTGQNSKQFLFAVFSGLMKVLSKEEFSLFEDEKFSKSNFSLHYSVLTTDPKMIRDRDGRRRYYAKKVGDYYLCNHWFELNL